MKCLCRLVRCMIGKDSRILSMGRMLSKGERLVVGENTTMYL